MTMPAKYKLVFEGFSTSEQALVSEPCNVVAALAERATKGNLPVGLLARWFGTQSDTALKKISLMNEYINGKCVLLTFVKKNIGEVVNGQDVGTFDCGQVIETVGVGFPGDFNPTNLTHVQSGLRIFILPRYWNFPQDRVRRERLNTGYDKCLILATTAPAKALGCADSFGYFIAELEGA